MEREVRRAFAAHCQTRRPDKLWGLPPLWFVAGLPFDCCSNNQAEPSKASQLPRLASSKPSPFTLPPFKTQVCAVDSEFSGVRQDDHSRLCQLMCHTVRERRRNARTTSAHPAF